MGTFCFDLDGTIGAYPDQMRALMQGLKAAGNRVVVLSGHGAEHVTQGIVDQKIQQLKDLGCGDCYDDLVVVVNPKNDVADQKVAQMHRLKATALLDDKKANVKAARKAGFLALHVTGKRS